MYFSPNLLLLDHSTFPSNHFGRLPRTFVLCCEIAIYTRVNEVAKF